MKFTFAIIAAAAATAPVISLNLEGAGLRDAKTAEHLSSKQVNTNKVHVCEAGAKSAKSDCALPTAKAYDHHDGELAVSKDIFLVRSEAKNNKDGLSKPGPRKSINYNLRSEYIIKYNAADASGNKADQVVFAVILQDHQKPVISLSYYAHTLKSTTFTYKANDFAGVFGVNGANNVANTKSVTYKVVDTTKPTVTINKGKDTVECSKKFTNAGAFCIDSHDSWVAGKFLKKVLAKNLKTDSNVNNMKTGAYRVQYKCKDFTGNAAAMKTRPVKIIDTVKPSLTICTGGSHGFVRAANGWTHNGKVANGKGCADHHTIQHSAGYTKDVQIIQFIADGSKQVCKDDCCGKLKVSTSWHSGSCSGPKTTFNTLKPASYFVKYSCTDCNKHTTTKCRTLINEDHTKPIIDILGSDLMTIEATYHKNYVDDGATCSDQVDGVISQQVEVSGDVVNLSKIGTYKISYKCKDAAGNAADTLTRTVVVKDTTCPTCTVSGSKTVKREASFPYSDLGAICTDNIDGNLGAAKVAGTFNVEKVGTYKLTYSTKDKSGNKNCKAQIRTIKVQDTLKPVISLHFNKKMIHKSGAGNRGTNGQFNPAHGAAANPYFMAESATSVNGWVIGAIASAVTGVALLGFSARKSTVATSVPV